MVLWFEPVQFDWQASRLAQWRTGAVVVRLVEGGRAGLSGARPGLRPRAPACARYRPATTAREPVHSSTHHTTNTNALDCLTHLTLTHRKSQHQPSRTILSKGFNCFILEQKRLLICY